MQRGLGFQSVQQLHRQRPQQRLRLDAQHGPQRRRMQRGWRSRIAMSRCWRTAASGWPAGLKSMRRVLRVQTSCETIQTQGEP